MFELPWVWVNRVLLKKQLQLAQDTIFVCSSCNVLVFALISRLLHVKFSLLWLAGVIPWFWFYDTQLKRGLITLSYNDMLMLLSVVGNRKSINSTQDPSSQHGGASSAVTNADWSHCILQEAGLVGCTGNLCFLDTLVQRESRRLSVSWISEICEVHWICILL